MRPDALSPINVGYANDLIAAIGHADPKIVLLLDPLTGRQLGTVQHTIDVEQVALSQRGDLSKRRLVLIDKNRDLYLTPVQGAQELHKLHIMVDSVAWNVESDAYAAARTPLSLQPAPPLSLQPAPPLRLQPAPPFRLQPAPPQPQPQPSPHPHPLSRRLAAVADGQLLVWFYPEVVYMDRELLPMTLSKQAVDWGKTAEILEFRETRVQVTAAATALPTAPPPLPPLAFALLSLALALAASPCLTHSSPTRSLPPPRSPSPGAPFRRRVRVRDGVAVPLDAGAVLFLHGMGARPAPLPLR